MENQEHIQPADETLDANGEPRPPKKSPPQTTPVIILIGLIMVMGLGLIGQNIWSKMVDMKRQAGQSSQILPVPQINENVRYVPIVRPPEPEPVVQAPVIEEPVIEEPVEEFQDQWPQDQWTQDQWPQDQWMPSDEEFQNEFPQDQGFGNFNLSEQDQVRLRQAGELMMQRFQNMSPEQMQAEAQRFQQMQEQWMNMSDQDRQQNAERLRQQFDDWLQSDQQEFPQFELQ